MFHLAVLVLALDEHVLEEVVVVLLHLVISHVGEVGAVRGLGGVLRVDVEVLREGRRQGCYWTYKPFFFWQI